MIDWEGMRDRPSGLQGVIRRGEIEQHQRGFGLDEQPYRDATGVDV